ncbi:MAG: hypothetical protein Q9198_007311 [Flavoplaca austrocitrina]
MADRCPNTIFGFALSGLSAAVFYFYGISVDPQALLQVEDLVAATPSPILSVDEGLPSAISAVFETYREGTLSQTYVIEKEEKKTPKKNGRVEELDDERIFDFQTDLSSSKTRVNKDVVHINELEQELGLAKGELGIFNVN